MVLGGFAFYDYACYYYNRYYKHCYVNFLLMLFFYCGVSLWCKDYVLCQTLPFLLIRVICGHLELLQLKWPKGSLVCYIFSR